MRVTKVDVRHNGERTNKTRIYIFSKVETILKMLEERHSRPYVEYKKLIPQIMKEVKKSDPDTYSILKDVKWKWLQTAGCSCGCSPGFIGGNIPKNIFVEIKQN